MAGLVYKPNTRKGPVFLTPNAGSAPTIKTKDGKIISLIRGDQAGGVFQGHEGYQWAVPKEYANDVINGTDLEINHNGQVGKIGKGSMSYRGDSFDNWQESSKGAVGSYGGPGGAFTPGQVGNFGFYPGFVGDQFPDAAMADFNPIKYKDITSAGYQYTDPLEFSRKYGEFNRNEILKNRITAKDTALSQLDTELRGLEGFAPAASALKRRETTLDNIFNQEERSRSVDAALPGVKKDLTDQRDRATAFASGRAPDSVTDRGLEINSRSRSADNATAGGFGATSSVAKKESDLRSADQRIQLSQYGDQLLTSNIGTRSNLLLPQTEYSDAGSQIRVTPEVGGGRLAANALTETNSLTTMSTGQAFQGEVQQQQFKTNLNQQTKMFNATNRLNTAQFNANGNFAESQFNANARNAFSMKLFDYVAGYAGAVAGAAQTNSNTNLALDQQKQNQDIYREYLGRQQQTQQTAAIADGITTAISAVGSLLSGGGSSSGGNTTPNNGDSSIQLPGSSTNPSSGGNISTTPSDTGDNGSFQLPGFDFNTGEIASNSSPIGSIDTIDASGGSSGGFDLSASGAGQLNYTPSGFESTFKALKSTVPGAENLNKEQTVALIQGANVALANLGVHDQPAQGTLPQLNSQGRPVYVANQPPAVANNTQAGGGLVSTLQGVLDPMGAFSREDATTLEKIGTVANDAAFISQLTGLAQRGDQTGFITALGSKVAPSIIKQSGLSKDNQAGLQAGVTAANVFTNWQNMNPAQRSLAVAQIGLQGYQFATGESLAQKVIPGTQVNGHPGLNIGEGLGLLAQGYNVYGMVANWDQLTTANKIIGGVQTGTGLAQTAVNLGLIGSGPTNAAVGVSASQLASSGFSSTGAYGVGALTGPANAAIPEGYSVIGKTVANEIIVQPTANASTSALSATNTAGSGVASTIGAVAGAAGVIGGAYTIYQGWGKGDGGVKGAAVGAIGGASIVAGLSAMGTGVGAPVGAAIIVAGALATMWGTSGKPEAQLARDAVRDMYVDTGFTNDKGEVTLADGTTSYIGMDGKTGRRQWKNPELAGEAGKRELNAYDIDFTNDLDTFSGMMGMALTRVKSGSNATHINQVGSQLGNAALGNVGFGKDLSEENFIKVRDNMRLFYAKNGIKSKAEAYALANQGYSEGRWNDTELVGMHQSFNMIFDNDGYKLSTQLARGTKRAIVATRPTGESKQPSTPSKTTNLFKDKSQFRTLPAKVTSNKDDVKQAINKIVMGKRGSTIQQLRA